MKAVAVFPSRKELKVIDHPEPKIESPTQAKLRMLDIGVCGTDKEIARFDYGTPPAGSDYLVIGHESLGRVVEVGSQATSVKVGDLVVTMVRRPCGHPECVACAAGRQDFCFTGDFTERGIKGRHGYMTESVVDDQRFMVIVPLNSATSASSSSRSPSPKKPSSNSGRSKNACRGERPARPESRPLTPTRPWCSAPARLACWAPWPCGPADSRP